MKVYNKNISPLCQYLFHLFILIQELDQVKGHTGKYDHYQLFRCLPRKGIFIPLSMCSYDKRFVPDEELESGEFKYEAEKVSLRTSIVAVSAYTFIFLKGPILSVKN